MPIPPSTPVEGVAVYGLVVVVELGVVVDGGVVVVLVPAVLS